MSLNVWFTRDPEVGSSPSKRKNSHCCTIGSLMGQASEDLKLLQHPPQLGALLPLPRRLFGQGPQEQWPEAFLQLARRTLATVGLPPRGGTLRVKRSGGWKTGWRSHAMNLYLMESCLLDFVQYFFPQIRE